MSTHDINLISFNGPHDNGKNLDWSDRNLTPAANMSDTVKCSTGLTGFSLMLGEVRSGREDAVDINNRCRDIYLSAKRWILEDCSMGFTIKGGTNGAHLTGEVDGHGRECDVDLGNASDQSHDLTEGVELNLWRANRGPIYVRVLNAALPYEVPGSGPYRYVFPWTWLPFRLLVVAIFMEWRRFKKRRLDPLADKPEVAPEPAPAPAN